MMTPKCGAKLDMTDVTERWRKLTYKTDAIETGSGIFWKNKKSYSRICLYVLPITFCFQTFVTVIRLAPSCKYLDIASGCVLGSM